jgi:hypothetical protein
MWLYLELTVRMTIELRCKDTYNEHHFNLHGYRLKYQHRTVLVVLPPPSGPGSDVIGRGK